MLEGFDWQPILIAAIALLSIINGLSVCQNTLSDRPKLRVEPVAEAGWMWWSEIIDDTPPEPIRRYVVIGNLGVMNIGRRPTSVADTELIIRLRNLRTAASSVYALPPPDVSFASTRTERPASIEPAATDEYRPLIQSGEAISGLHCFLFGMYGSDLWAPKTDGGMLEGNIQLTDVFGRCYKSKLAFRFAEFEALEEHFPKLRSFVMENLESELA